jgi:hypothetical protein
LPSSTEQVKQQHFSKFKLNEKFHNCFMWHC